MQDNPRDEVRAIIASIQGDLSNEIDNLENRDRRLKRMKRNLLFLQQIMETFEPGEWTESQKQMLCDHCHLLYQTKCVG